MRRSRTSSWRSPGATCARPDRMAPVLRFDPVAQMTLAKVRELLREPEALFWVFIFPVLLTVALGIAFRSRGPEVLPIGIEQGPGAEELHQALADAPGLRAQLLSKEQAREKLRNGSVALVLVPGDPWIYWTDPDRPDSRVARLAVDDALQRWAGRTDVRASTTRDMSEKGSRYIDFLVPGMLGMNLMGTGMWGIGFYIVNS